MIQGGAGYIVGAYAFAYVALCGYGFTLWRRRRSMQASLRAREDYDA